MHCSLIMHGIQNGKWSILCSKHVLNVRLSEKIGLFRELQVRNNKSLQRCGSSLSSGHVNRASVCQRLFQLVNFWEAEGSSFGESNFYTVSGNTKDLRLSIL